MDLLIRMLILIGFFIFLTLAGIGTKIFIRRRNLAKFENYDRELSPKELAYLEQAETTLEAAAEVNTPKWYKVILYTALLPAMVVGWAFIGGLLLALYLLIGAPDVPPEGVILITGGELIAAPLVTVFAGGMFLVGAALYALSLKKQAFSNFVALNSNAHGNNKDAVRQGLLAKLEHKIRSREHFTVSAFSADEFLTQVNISYRAIYLKLFYASLIAGGLLAIFDLRSGVEFYENEMVGTGAYFTVAPKKTIPYERVTNVGLDCYYNEGDPTATYAVFADDKEFVSMFLNQDNLPALGELNEVLRERSRIKFEPRIDKKGVVWLNSKCVDLLGQEWGEPELVQSILAVES